jgi:hypothetical protein
VKFQGPNDDTEVEVTMIDADGATTDDPKAMRWGEAWWRDAEGRVLRRDYIVADRPEHERRGTGH